MYITQWRQFVSFYIEVARKTCTYLRFWSFISWFNYLLTITLRKYMFRIRYKQQSYALTGQNHKSLKSIQSYWFEILLNFLIILILQWSIFVMHTSWTAFWTWQFFRKNFINESTKSTFFLFILGVSFLVAFNVFFRLFFFFDQPQTSSRVSLIGCEQKSLRFQIL